MGPPAGWPPALLQAALPGQHEPDLPPLMHHLLCCVAPGTCPQLLTLNSATRARPWTSWRERLLVVLLRLPLRLPRICKTCSLTPRAHSGQRPSVLSTAGADVALLLPGDSSLGPRHALPPGLGEGTLDKDKNICHLTLSFLVVSNLPATGPIQRWLWAYPSS